MCIIIDASVLGKFLADPPNEDAAPIHTWLIKRKGKLVYSTGGKFAREIVGKARQRLLDYVRAGLAVEEIRRDRLLEEEQELAEEIKSDDPHVLALARVSGARLLYTGDGDLIVDFKTKRFIDQPRGKVYSSAANRNLLSRTRCVPNPP